MTTSEGVLKRIKHKLAMKSVFDRMRIEDLQTIFMERSAEPRGQYVRWLQRRRHDPLIVAQVEREVVACSQRLRLLTEPNRWSDDDDDDDDDLLYMATSQRGSG